MKALTAVLVLLFTAPAFADYSVFYDPVTGEIQEITLLETSGSENANTLVKTKVPDNSPILTNRRVFYRIDPATGRPAKKTDQEITDVQNKEQAAVLEQKIIANAKKLADKAILDEQGIPTTIDATAVQQVIDTLKVQHDAVVSK